MPSRGDASPGRIVVIAPNWLGDAVMALPAIAAFRGHHPAASIVVAGRASTVPLFSMAPSVDEVVRLDSRGGILGAISWAEDAAVLRSAGADLAILLPNSFRSAWTANRAGIPERWGYAADLRGRLLTRRVARLRGPFHMAEYYRHLVAELTAPASGHAAPASGHAALLLPRLAAPAEARERAGKLLADLGLAGDALLVGMAPGAAYGKAKQWPPDRFADLAVDLHQRLGATSLLFGARADARSSGTIARKAGEELQNRQNGASGAVKPAVVDLAGRTDLPLLVALMARCGSVVSNDSGAMHVAAATGVPVTAIFGSTDERGTAPLPCETPASAPHEILTAPVWCRPCMLRECPIDHRCMRRVSVAAAAEAVTRQVGRGRAQAD
jgi:heptosyltransferase-2